MAGMDCPFFGVGALESTGDSVIFSMMTEAKGVGGILHVTTYVMYIGFDKMHFTFNWVNLGCVQYFKEQEFKFSIKTMQNYPRNE